jgi:DNA polymerase III epsilon subunit-like protein
MTTPTPPKKNFNSVPQFGLAIDWETSGYSTPNYAAKHQGISFGAIIFDVRTLEPVEKLYVEIKFDPKYIWDSGAEKVHGITREHLAKNGVTQEEAAFLLAGLVVKYIGTEDVLMLGHNVYFDKAFTIQLLDAAGIEFKYHQSVIDTRSIATVLMELTYSDDIFATLGLPPRGKHNAMEDIEYTLETVRRIKEFFIAGIASTL